MLTFRDLPISGVGVVRCCHFWLSRLAPMRADVFPNQGFWDSISSTYTSEMPSLWRKMKMTAIKLTRAAIESMFPSSRLCIKAMIPDWESAITLPSPAKIAPNTTRSHLTEAWAERCPFDSSNCDYWSQNSLFKDPWKTSAIVTKHVLPTASYMTSHRHPSSTASAKASIRQKKGYNFHSGRDSSHQLFW